MADFSSAKFSLNGAPPSLLPEILHLPGGVIRQSCCVTVEELSQLGYLGPFSLPEMTADQTCYWDSTHRKFFVIPLTPAQKEEELTQLARLKDAQVRKQILKKLISPWHPTLAWSQLAPYYREAVAEYRDELISVLASKMILTSMPAMTTFCKYVSKSEAEAAYQVWNSEERDSSANFNAKNFGTVVIDPELIYFYKLTPGLTLGPYTEPDGPFEFALVEQ